MSTAHVLVVEDNTEIRETLCELLRSEGFGVVGVEHGEAALRSMEERGPPCLILLDLMMPVMDGWAFLAAMKAHSGPLAAVPVAILSGVTDALDVPDGHVVLRKPVEVASLLGVVQGYCPDRGATG